MPPELLSRRLVLAIFVCDFSSDTPQIDAQGEAALGRTQKLPDDSRLGVAADAVLAVDDFIVVALLAKISSS